MPQIATIVAPEKWVGHRSEERKAVIGNVVIKGSSGDGGLMNIEGVTRNMSNTGACIYISRNLEEGHRVMVCGKAFGNISRRAEVVWRNRISRRVFMIGISFTE